MQEVREEAEGLQGVKKGSRRDYRSLRSEFTSSYDCSTVYPLLTDSGILTSYLK